MAFFKTVESERFTMESKPNFVSSNEVHDDSDPKFNSQDKLYVSSSMKSGEKAQDSDQRDGEKHSKDMKLKELSH